MWPVMHPAIYGTEWLSYSCIILFAWYLHCIPIHAPKNICRWCMKDASQGRSYPDLCNQSLIKRLNLLPSFPIYPACGSNWMGGVRNTSGVIKIYRRYELALPRRGLCKQTWWESHMWIGDSAEFHWAAGLIASGGSLLINTVLCSRFGCDWINRLWCSQTPPPPSMERACVSVQLLCGTQRWGFHC